MLANLLTTKIKSLLELILLTSFTTLGLFITGYGFVLNPMRAFIAKMLGGKAFLEDGEWYYSFHNGMGKLWKPLWGCYTCMPSLWGIAIYSCLMPYTWATFYELPILILSSACINFIIFNNLIKKCLID
jgi:hypothetical protein